MIAFAPLSQIALAECLRDEDWPDKPCFDSGTPSKDELVQAWDKYYEFKGKNWMEMKKTDMDNAIEKGTFGEWINDEVSGSANNNVYSYYRVHEAVPNMILDPSSGDYYVQGSEPKRGDWYASTIGITTIAGIGAAAAVASLLAFKKAMRK